MPLESLTFFIDRSLGRAKVAAALRDAGAHVEIHDDHFDASAPDTEWLSRAGAQSWIVLTKDRRIRYRAVEREVLTGAGVRAFVLNAGSASGEDMARAYVAALPAIRRLVAARPAPFIATVALSGSVNLLES